ncbi:hypothetical protein ACKVMT_17515 [Halobacteriales archaeon Cl-PHB]
MAPTVDDLRNEIRQSVGRFEREVSSGFTKESLAAIADAVGHDVDATGQLPPKPEMRAGILAAIGEVKTADAEAADRPFRKGELEAIAAALRADDR